MFTNNYFMISSSLEEEELCLIELKPWLKDEAMLSNTFHKWKEKNKNVKGASTYTSQPYKIKFMDSN
jgi:hypothetical protein